MMQISQPALVKPSFEDSIKIINEEIAKRKGRWRLTAISWMDFDDVSQKLRIHIFNKWHLWDEIRPLRPWLNRLISHQISNMIRNYYSSFSKPCLQCKWNHGGDLCEIYDKQCGECPLYHKWEKSKKHAYDIKLPVSIHDDSMINESGDNMAHEIRETEQFLDFDAEVGNFHLKIKPLLTAVEWKIYELLYIFHKTDEEAAETMEYSTTEPKRIPGYKQIKKVKNKILSIAKELVRE